MCEDGRDTLFLTSRDILGGFSFGRQIRSRPARSFRNAASFQSNLLCSLWLNVLRHCCSACAIFLESVLHLYGITGPFPAEKFCEYLLPPLERLCDCGTTKLKLSESAIACQQYHALRLKKPTICWFWLSNLVRG